VDGSNRSACFLALGRDHRQDHRFATRLDAPRGWRADGLGTPARRFVSTPFPYTSFLAECRPRQPSTGVSLAPGVTVTGGRDRAAARACCRKWPPWSKLFRSWCSAAPAFVMFGMVRRPRGRPRNPDHRRLQEQSLQTCSWSRISVGRLRLDPAPPRRISSATCRAICSRSWNPASCSARSLPSVSMPFFNGVSAAKGRRRDRGSDGGFVGAAWFEAGPSWAGHSSLLCADLT